MTEQISAALFTTGEWTVREFPDEWDTVWCVGTENAVVATVYSEYPDREQGRKDAVLISAAKDLYVALAEMVETYREDGSDDDEQPVMVRAALRALAKASA